MSNPLEISGAEAAVGYFILFRVWHRLMQQNEHEAMQLVSKLRDSIPLRGELFDAAHCAFRWTAGLPIEPEYMTSVVLQ